MTTSYEGLVRLRAGFCGKKDALGQNAPQSGPKCQGGGAITAYVVVHIPPTVRQPLVRPESAVGRCWSAARRPEASRIHKIDTLYGGSPISGADSLVICSQNRFWYPKLLPQLDRPAWV